LCFLENQQNIDTHHIPLLRVSWGAFFGAFFHESYAHRPIHPTRKADRHSAGLLVQPNACLRPAGKSGGHQNLLRHDGEGTQTYQPREVPRDKPPGCPPAGKRGFVGAEPSKFLAGLRRGELYLATYVRPNYRIRSAREVERLLKKGAELPALHEISTKHITDILDGMPPSEANHVFGVLRTFFNWCERRELVHQSPVRKLLKPHKENSRDRVLTEDEIRKLWVATEEPTTFNRLLRLALLLGQRRGELAAIKREWVTDGVLTFPKEVMKQNREHFVPLPPLAAEIICTTTFDGYNMRSKPKAELDARLQFSTPFVIHDLRRTVSSSLGQMGVAPHIIDCILGHSTGSISPIARRYNRYAYLPEMREALEKWEARLLAVVAGQA
jgi:integrase